MVPAFPPSSPCLGCGPAPSGFTGTTDYTPANTAEFNDLTSRLTNGIDEVLQLSDLFYPSLFGGALLTLESSRFDLQGDTIDFIRRVIFSNTLTIENVLGVQETLTNVDVSWEIWGASQVPEPGTLILLSIGLVSLGMMRRLTPSGRRAGAEPLRSAAPDRRGTALESAG